MFTDLTGRRRLKLNLHAHTTLSDGHKTPEEAAAMYQAAGYDAIALTDHWRYGSGGELSGLTILSGCEYNVMGVDAPEGIMEVYHIVAVGTRHEPAIPKSYMTDQGPGIRARVRAIIAAIRAAGGLAVLAHPAWSLNTPEQMLGIGDFDATEIYNSVSDWGMSDRPYSGLILDEVACYGLYRPLLATDDTHYYNGDHARGAVMVEADAVERVGMVEALRAGCFYATQGPEVHLERVSDTQVALRCSPAVKIAFLSNMVWASGRMVRGSNLTEATYTIKPDDRFLRVEVTDSDGRVGYSNILPLS